MCDPVSLTIGGIAASTALSLYGSQQSAKAASSAARATEASNLRTQTAQNNAFNQRMAAASRQTDAQTAVMRQTMQDRFTADQQMRDAQGRAMDLNKANLARENQTAETLRAQGDTQAQDLLAKTNADRLAASEAQRAQSQNLLLDQNMPTTGPGPSTTDPTGNVDPETKKALARRGAEAASNVREYGAKVAKVASYGQPVMDVGQAIAGNKFGIMPAETADQLLRAGAPTRALPGQIAFRSAGSEGASLDELIRSRGQSGMDTAGLEMGNATGLANLRQGNENVLASNTLGQAKADAAYQQQLAGIWGQLGQLGMYSAGYFGGSPFGGGTKFNPAGGLSSVPGTSPGYTGTFNPGGVF